MNFKPIFGHSLAASIAVLASVSMHGAPVAGEANAMSANSFLDSIGTLTAISVRGEQLEKTIDCVRYLGIRWLRAGIEGNVPLEQFLRLHKETGVRFSWGLGSGSSDIGKLIETARPIAGAGALLAFEGPNEPNNWGITYQGEKGGRDQSWIPVAKLQRDLYRAVKSDPVLKQFPVWSISEPGAETENVGLQFLAIPDGANCLMPPGTRYADFVNVHNYIYHPNSSHVEDNKTWNAADPGKECKVDGLYGEHGMTWARHFAGYAENELRTLPRVTTETGTTIGDDVTEEIHALNLLTMYLDQFKRGWSYTAVYLLHDRVDEAGNQKFGFYRPDYTPRPAAMYLHNLTTILADRSSVRREEKLGYRIQEPPSTVHDLLLQKGNGDFELLVWNEQVKDSASVRIDFEAALSSVKLFDVTVGTEAIQTLANVTAITMNLSNHPVVFEMKSGGGHPR
jgi:hypothetical protein